jgi:KaiC/GvpD/RAD55 family RecA-like ATPase
MSLISSVGTARPDTIGPYRILDVLGQGGMGVVYRAEHADTGERVALKTVRLPQTSELSGIRGEILALTRVRHPGVVRILGQGVDGGLPWYAMEMLEGRTLTDYHDTLWGGVSRAEKTNSTNAGVIEARLPSEEETVRATTAAAKDDSVKVTRRIRPTIPLAPVANGRLGDVLTLVHRLCGSLSHIHGKGIVHRDLKPANVFIRNDGAPVLMDFGLVSRFRGAVGRESLEVAGMMVGTAAYVAPEQIRGYLVDARADLYALGVMLYELCCGRRPFLAEIASHVLDQHLFDPPLPPSQLVDGVPTKLDDLILRLLAKRPRDRFGHADDVAGALVELGVQGEGVREEEVRPRAYLYRPELAGRQETLEELHDCIEKAREGHGRMVLIAGESGVGKTFLVAEAARAAMRRGLRVVTGECLPVKVSDGTGIDLKGAPLHPFRPLLQTIADRCRELGRERTESIIGRWGKVLAPYQPALLHLPGFAAQPEPPELGAEAAHRRLLEALAETLAAFAAEEGPLLLILDDLQWGDELSLSFLNSLAPDFVDDKRLLIVGTYRTDESAALASLIRKPGHRRVELGRLDEKTVGTIVGDMLAMASPPAPFVRFLARQSEGNPFFVAEYLRTAVAERLLYREAGAWRFSGEESMQARFEMLPLPRSVRELVGRRLSGLGDRGRALVEAASVLGREVDADLLHDAAGIAEDDALEHLKDLAARQVLEVIEEAGRYRFVHDKLREITSQQIAPERRRKLHHAAANALERKLTRSGAMAQQYGELANHWVEAEVWPKAVEYLEKAGEQALRDFSNREAAEFFEAAVELSAKLGAPVGRLRMTRWERSLVEAHLGLGESEKGQLHAERALRHAGRPMPSTTAGWLLVLLWQILVRVVQSWFPARFKVRDPVKRQLTLEAAYVSNRMLEPFFLANKPIHGTCCGMRNLNLAEQVEPSAALARGYAFMCMIVGLTPLQKVAQAWSERALAIAEKLGSDTALIYCLARTSCYSISVGRWAEAEERLRRGADLALASGDRRQLEEVLSILGVGLHANGRFTDSIGACRQVLASAAQRGDEETQCWARSVLGENLARVGREEEALEALAESRPWVESEAPESEAIWWSGAVALGRLQSGDSEGARHAAGEGLVRMQRQRPVQYYMGATVSIIAEVYLALWEAAANAESASVRELAESAHSACDILAGFSRLLPYARPAALRWRGLAEWLSGRSSAAHRTWARALAEAERLQMPYEQARTHLEIGRHLDGPARRTHLTASSERLSGLKAARDLRRTLDEAERRAPGN